MNRRAFLMGTATVAASTAIPLPAAEPLSVVFRADISAFARYQMMTVKQVLAAFGLPYEAIAAGLAREKAQMTALQLWSGE